MNEGITPWVTSPFARVPGPPGAASRLRQSLMDLLFPPRCVVCRRAGSAFCPACQSGVDLSDVGLCSRPDAEPSGYLSGIRSAGVYQPPLSAAIRAFKYRRRTDLACSLAAMMARAWQGWSEPPAFVAPVPLHENRLRERGYNQAELLAIEFCRSTRLPLVLPGLLARHRDTEHQVQLGLAERRQNVKDAFVWKGPRLDGLAVLLVDDVATTGSTLEACAEALARAGASGLRALTVARAVDDRGKSDRHLNTTRRAREG